MQKSRRDHHSLSTMDSYEAVGDLLHNNNNHHHHHHPGEEVKENDDHHRMTAPKNIRRMREALHMIPKMASGRKSSIYKGVSRHKWTGRYEAQLWDKSSWNETQKKKGKQVYIGAFDEEKAAARAYDLAVLKYFGAAGTITNFPLADYVNDLQAMENVSREEYLASLRRRSSGSYRGLSKYRHGVVRRQQVGRWKGRTGTQEEAATGYRSGLNAVTNFELRWLNPLCTPKHIQESIQHNSCKTIPRINTPSSSTTSALNLLLQSSLFKNMVEETAVEGRDFSLTSDHNCKVLLNTLP